ncbi:hypothetical protein, partial [Klebsiella variicola]|uniref:hypothetical protein n=2 Tax=Klebsiella variicola TaxID=244366 RepID=UPI001953EC57
WLEHHLDMVGVDGSSPFRRTNQLSFCNFCVLSPAPDGIADLKCCVLAKIFPCIFHTRAGEANPFKYIFEHIEMAL